MWKNMVQPDRPEMTLYNMAHALCMLGKYGYRHTLRIVILMAFAQQQWLGKRA
jgi:hypothetical protein